MSKQVVYICEGVTGALLSLEACIDLGLVSTNFPQPFQTSSCESVVDHKNLKCDCKCPIRAKPHSHQIKYLLTQYHQMLKNLKNGSGIIMQHQHLTVVNVSHCQRCMVRP